LKDASLKITPVILCGGSGTRLWPLSRQHYPKQFLNLFDDKSLFQQCVDRALDLEKNHYQIEEILIVTNESHRFLVLEQVDELQTKVPIRILLEPESKNTAPALTLAALAAQVRNQDSILVVTPADHYVKDTIQFTLAIHEAIAEVSDTAIIALGIKPTSPNTGFGYIQYDEGEKRVKDVLKFIEKPELKNKKKMIHEGSHAWNSGIFILRSDVWLNSIKKSNLDLYARVSSSFNKASKDSWFERPDEFDFKSSPSDSIDYAVMEKHSLLGIQIKLVLLDAGWSDLGAFTALNEIVSPDKNGNISEGDVVSLKTKNTIAISNNKNLSLLGVENLIVVALSDSVLVAHKDFVQSIKDLVKILEKTHEDIIVSHTKENRPWGFFETVEEGKNYKVKLIQIDPGKSISLQKHHQRSEHWVVVSGVASIVRGDEQFELIENQSTYIEKNQIHRLSNNTDKMLKIIEIQTGDHLSEDDIVRLDDNYGR